MLTFALASATFFKLLAALLVIVLIAVIVTARRKSTLSQIVMIGSLFFALGGLFTMTSLAFSSKESMVVVIENSENARAFNVLPENTALFVPSLSKNRGYLVSPRQFRLKGQSSHGKTAADYDLSIILRREDVPTFVWFLRAYHLLSPSGHYIQQAELESYLRGTVDTTLLLPHPNTEEVVQRLQDWGLTVDEIQSTIRIYPVN